MTNLRISHVTHKYQDSLVLDFIDYDFEFGKKYYITGSSGCGKSTLGMILAGLTVPTKGSVSGNEAVAILFQNPDLQFCMDTVFNEMIFVLENLNAQPDLMEGLIDEALLFTQCSNLKYRILTTLSGGEKQRIALASLYLINGSVLILDEPFANLDRHSSKQLLNSIMDLQKQRKFTLIVIDHLHELYEGNCDIYLQMKAGKLTESADKESYESVVSYTKKSKSETVLKVDDLNIIYGNTKIVNGMSFEVFSGEMVCLNGQNGSGKTSILKTFLGLTTYTGNITISGTSLKKYHGRLGYLFQNPHDQFLFATVYDEIYKTCGDASISQTCLESLGLWQHRHLSPFKLSHGQQRRLALGIVFVTQAPLLILDEPTYGQDKNNAIIIMNMIGKYAFENNVPVLFTSHDPWLIKTYAHRSINMASL